MAFNPTSDVQLSDQEWTQICDTGETLIMTLGSIGAVLFRIDTGLPNSLDAVGHTLSHGGIAAFAPPDPPGKVFARALYGETRVTVTKGTA